MFSKILARNDVGRLVADRALPLALVAFYPITFLIKGGASIATAILAVAVLLSRTEIFCKAGITNKTASEFFWVYFAFILFALTGMVLIFYHEEPIDSIGAYIPFLLTPFIAEKISRKPIPSVFFWSSASLGAIAAFSVALYQNAALQNYRANGFFTNPIFFGNFSLLLGIASFLGVIFFQTKWHKSFLILFIFGAVGGLFGSFLSGSKGGWISIPLVILYLLRLAYQRWSKTYFMTGSMALVLIVSLAVLLPNSPVTGRVANLSSDLNAWRAGDDSAAANSGTASSRLEMWRFAFAVIGERPLAGFGKQNLQDRKQTAVEDGQAHPIVAKYKHVHNEILDIYLERGLIGLFSWIILFGSIFMLFYKFRTHCDPEVKALSTVGMIMVLLFVEFGLTNPLFPFNTPRNFFCGTAAILMGMIVAVANHSSAKNSPDENLLRPD